MRRYARIYRTFFSSALTRELEFRVNFFAKVFHNVMWVGFFVAILHVIYQNTRAVAGWSEKEAWVLAASVFLLDAVRSAFFMSLTEIPEQVRKGTLDFVVTKPVDSQFWISMRRFNFDQIGGVLAGLVMIGYAAPRLETLPSVAQWAAYLLAMAAALVLVYSFNLALMTTGIWLIRVDNLWVLSESVMQVARYPIDIYGAGAVRLLTYAIPLGMVATVPARQLTQMVRWEELLGAVAWAAASFVASRAFWRFGMRHYGSASS